MLVSSCLVDNALVSWHAVLNGLGHPLLDQLEVLQQHKKFVAIVLVGKGVVQLFADVFLEARKKKGSELFGRAHICVEVVLYFELVLFSEAQ